MFWNKKVFYFAVIPLVILMICSNVSVWAGAVKLDTDESQIDLTFLANEGVMIAVDNNKVLIDALFDNPHPNYEAPPKDMLEGMVSGQSPFDNVELVLITHNHPDHFSPSLGALFIENNPNAVFMAAVDTVSAMKEHIKEWERVQDRIISFDLKPGEMAERTVKDIPVKIFRTLHSGDRESPHNLMYLIKMNGRTIFHEGDSDGKLATFKKLGFEKEKIDLALVHFWFPLHPEGERIIQEVLQPEHTGLIHLPKRLVSDTPGKIDMVKAKYKDLFLFLKSGEKRIIR